MLILHPPIHASLNQYLFMCQIMEQREDNIFLWCDFFKEEIIIKIRMLDFLVFQTLSTVPRKQRCSFIECHLTVFLEGIALCSPPPGCSSFSGITRMSVNIWVTWFLLGKPCLTLREKSISQSNLFLSPSLSVALFLHPPPSYTHPNGCPSAITKHTILFLITTIFYLGYCNSLPIGLLVSTFSLL